MLAVLSLGLFICASTAGAEPTSDDIAPLPIEGLKDSVVERLAKCETKGRADADSQGTSKNAPVNDGLVMDADVLWFRRGFVGAGSTFLAS